MPADHGTAAPDADRLLNALPYGVLALAPDGTILRVNAAARELVPELGGPGTRSCRDLFACRAPGGPCGGGCLVARTAAGTTASPEVRIDTTGGTSPGALWVTAAPLPDGEGATLHLRAGWRADRRRRSQDGAHSGPELRIRTFGRTELQSREDTLEGDWLGHRPGQLLKYLVCQRGRVSMVDQIAEAIWPEGGPRAIRNTRYSIHRLRTKLEPRRAPHDASSFVVARHGGYVLDTDRVWIDADEFDRTVEAGQMALARGDIARAASQLEQAVDLYRGEFLEDEPYADWATDERHRLGGLAVSALQVLVRLAHERGDAAGVLRHVQQLAAIEPLDNAVHRELIQALLAEGRRGDARRRYETFATRVRRELGQDPTFDMSSFTEAAPDARR